MEITLVETALVESTLVETMLLVNHISGNCFSGSPVNGNWEKGFFKKDCAPLLRERELEHSFESCVAQEQWWKLWPPNWEIGHSNRWSVALWIKGYQYFENLFDNFTFQTSEQVFLVIFYKFWWFPEGLENIFSSSKTSKKGQNVNSKLVFKTYFWT